MNGARQPIPRSLSCRSPNISRRALRPLDLIATARKLAAPVAGSPSDCDLRRAVSTAYYALFHTIAASAADFLIIDGRNDFAREASSVAYRALDHATLKNACRNQSLRRRLPKALDDFADLLLVMQLRRHQADYSPMTRFSANQVDESIDACEAAISAFAFVDEADRRAFVVFALFRNR